MNDNWNFNWATDDEIQSFWQAIDRGDVGTVRRQIATNPKILRWERGDGLTPLDLYALASRPTDEMLDFLNANRGDLFDLTGNPVLVACMEGKTKALRSMMKHGFDPNGSVRIQFSTPLHAAVESSSVELVRILLDAGANYCIENGAKRTPLETAQELKNLKCISLLDGLPAKRRVKFVDPRKVKKTLEFNLMDEKDAVLSLIKKGIRAAKKAANTEITAVALHVSGYKGFVEFGCHTNQFDFRVPDCGADVSLPSLARREFSRWRNAYNENNRIVVHYGAKKPWNKTTLSSFGTLDTPYFLFFKSFMKDTVKEGSFDTLPISPTCLFGVQTYFHHHSEFFDRNGKKAK